MSAFTGGHPVAGSTGEPGEVLSLSKQGLLVACGEDAYLAERIQLPLGKGSVLGGADVMNGYPALFQAGTRFSNGEPTPDE